uniref:C2H2-type domain-containing protein n=1 Tax=Syphacia muris TaxID=451379 RepID=A0A0N5ABP3_9BILA
SRINVPVQNHQQTRKRRRGEVANPANTLDGLVAKRADDIGRYLTENEAIESPSDDQELKRIETDPDVSTRTCSICGYQGKWVSEMIRHKRVHTNERPFKCKYCSRTSKWKADLIRHVAKTHGIRVVSKYSRSKTFDASATGLHELKDNKPEVLQAQTNESILVLMSHLRNVHNAAPYECHSCNECFNDAQTAMSHFTATTKCSRMDLMVNIAPIYNTQQSNLNFRILLSSSFLQITQIIQIECTNFDCRLIQSVLELSSPLSLLGTAGINNTQELLRRLMSTPTNNTALLPLLNQLQLTAALTNFKNTLATAPTSEGSSVDSGIGEDFDKRRAESCDKCPYKGDADSFMAHKKGHEIPKGKEKV